MCSRSIASIMKYISDPATAATAVYTEADWNPTTFEQGKASNVPIFAYAASKVLAEKAAWAYVEEHKPSYKVATILPSESSDLVQFIIKTDVYSQGIVYGPSTQPTSTWPVGGTNRCKRAIQCLNF